MATVITNLMSAIPWIGQDIVEFLLIISLLFYTYFAIIPIIINKCYKVYLKN